MSFAIRCLLLGALAASAASIHMGKEMGSETGRDKVKALEAVNTTIQRSSQPTEPGATWIWGSVSSIAATGFTKAAPDGVGSTCTGISDMGALPLLYGNSGDHDGCIALAASTPTAVGYQWGTQTACFIYFATTAECQACRASNDQFALFADGLCTRCYGGCSTYSPSGPFGWFDTNSASGTTKDYTCYYKGGVTSDSISSGSTCPISDATSSPVADPASGTGDSTVASRTGDSTVASGTGDPHLRNIHGQAFDLMQPGKHVLLLVPRGADSNGALLRVEAGAHRVGLSCADMYFTEVNVTGAWAEARRSGGAHYHAEDAASEGDDAKWNRFGKVDLKVAHGRTKEGVRYLNFYVRHLKNAGLAIGGLLGEDDHEAAATPDPSCRKVLALGKRRKESPIAAAPPTASLAEASME